MVMQNKLNIQKTTSPAFFYKDKMFFVSYCVVIWQEHHKDFSYLFFWKFGQTSLLKKLWWGFVHLWSGFFYSFSKLLLGLRPCIWSCQFYLSQSWEQWACAAPWGLQLGFVQDLLCRNLLHRLGVCQSPKDIPPLAHVLISILSFPLILWWKVHASSLTREWCFFLFFLSPCLNFLASLLFLSLYSLPFVSDAEMKIVGCKFLLFCVMSAFCLLFFHFHIFHGMLGLIKTANHNITGKLW